MTYLDCFTIIAVLEQEVQVQDSFISITEITIHHVLELLRNHGTEAKVGRENVGCVISELNKISYPAAV